MAHSEQKAISFLEFSFFFALITHGLGLLSMALLVMPGMPGGLVADEQRISYISSHPLLWKAGWLPWHLSALSDLLIACAFLRMNNLPWSIKSFVLFSTLAAITPDQYGQFLWVSRGVELAQSACKIGDISSYLNFEEPVFLLVCGWAALLYTVLALAWTLALATLNLAGKKLQRYSYFLWALSGICSLLFLCSSIIKLPFLVLAIANALFFPGLIFWFVFVLENIIRSSRLTTLHGRLASWKVPASRSHSGFIQLLGNSLFLRRCFEPIPPLPLASKIDSVVYINFLIPAERALRYLPEGLELQRLGPAGEYTLFSILTFRHEQFGPQFLGSFRRQLFSGIVSNWRIHVIEPRSGRKGIYFLSNLTDSPLLSLGARILSEAMPMHIVADAQYRNEGSQYSILLEGADGSAFDLRADLTLCQESDFDLLWQQDHWRDCFDSFRDFLQFCVPQERSISTQDYLGRACFQEIKLDIPIEKCRPLKGPVSSIAVENIAGNTTPLCFAAPAVNFRFDREHYLKI